MRCSVVVLSLFLITGCSGKVNQTSTFVDHTPNSQAPLIFSGSPERDAIALSAANERLDEADWKLLEQLGPRAMFEKLERHKQREREDAEQPKAQRGLIDNDLIVEAPTIQLPDGRIRMIYRLRHYGGKTISTALNQTPGGGVTRRQVSAALPDLKPLVEVISSTLGKDGLVAALPDENTLVITCDQEMRESVLRLLAQVDVAPRQVEITAKMFEVSHDFDFKYGAELVLRHLAEDNSQTLISSFSTRSFVDSLQRGAPNTDGSVLNLMKVFQDAGVSLEGTFQILQEKGLINIVAAPRMTVNTGQTGYMLAGQEIPIQSVSIVNNNQQITTTYKPVGVQLYVTPQTMGPDTVKLHAVTVVSAISGFVPLPSVINNGPNRLLINPIIDSREAETSVMLEDGSTLVFGGLRMVRTTSRESKIPGLGDIPALGWLFKNHRTQKQITDLYFFVKPTLL